MDEQEVPYNPKNKVIADEDVKRLLTTYDITIPHKNIDIYRNAFVHKSYVVRKNDNFIDGNKACPPNCLPLQEESNERLEFLGDSVLSVAVASYLFERFPDENEGFLTRMRTKLVNGKMLAHLSKTVGLNEYLIISHQIEENDGRSILNILEDAFEAFLAAIYQDLGFQAAHDWVLNVIETHLDFAELIRINNNFKDQVLKYFQHNHGYLPRFYELNVETMNNQKVFKVCMKDQHGNILGTGKGNNKKEAENDAALQVLKRYCVEMT